MPLRPAVFLLVLLPLAGAQLRLGRGAADITPPAGMPMGGGFNIRLSTGVHDPLYCKALVWEKDGAKAATVTCDVESLHRPTVEQARAIISRTTGLRGEQVMITATHSHSGPEMTPLVLEGAQGKTARLAKEYHAALPGKIAEAVRLAEAGLVPERAWAARAREGAISFNRRYLMKDGSVRMNPGQMNPDIVRPAGPIDPELSVAYFDSPDATPLATVVNFALHTTTWGRADFSSDYPGILARLLGEAKGTGMMTVFLQGCSVHHGSPIHAEVQAIALGDQLAWIGLPGEVFTELGMALRKASPFPHTVISELANNMLDYIPDRKGYAEGSYEPATARCLAGCGEMLVDAAAALLVEVYQENHRR